MADWHVADGQRRLGPFSSEALQAALERGELSDRCLVWREGMAGWEPISKHFQKAARASRRRRRTSPLEFLILLAMSLLYTAAAALAVTLLYLNGLDLLPRPQATLIWTAGGVALAVTALAGPVLWWRWTGRWLRAELRGLFRIMAIILVLVGASLAAMQLFQARHVATVSTAAETMRHYSFAWDGRSRTVKIDGMIGPGFARRLKAELTGRDVARVEITSPGGLIDEAMRSARMLQARPGMTVVARAQCASACIIVLMGGETRLADYDMTIGFHAYDAIVDLKSDWSTVATRRQGREADRYMLARGAPAEPMKESARLGPATLYMVPSVDLVENGMLTGLVDEDGRLITLPDARAKLRALEADLEVEGEE
ncbi:MAG: GYF domain-containing protein [Caulobacter sp.]|nr:GYF domain-containing protein [Caulobacter sp.]